MQGVTYSVGHEGPTSCGMYLHEQAVALINICALSNYAHLVITQTSNY